jgi:KDO2-lipid IV(A) lauroyltransferase
MREKAYRAVLAVTGAIPLRLRAILFELVLLLAWSMDAKHRKIARINLRIAFPEMEDREAARIIRLCYKRIGIAAAEFVHMPKMDRKYIEEHVRIEGIEHIRRSEREQGSGVLALTGHFGNWELSSHAYGALFAPMAFIVRPIADPAWDRIVTERRECIGNRVLRKFDSAKEVMREVRRGTMVGILNDGSVPRDKGVLVDFFSKKTYTNYGIARMALALRTNIHPGFIFRDPERKFHHTLRFGPAIPMDPEAPREEEVERLTRRCNEELEKAIREDPTQWLWVYRRWKTTPPGEPDLYREVR